MWQFSAKTSLDSKYVLLSMNRTDAIITRVSVTRFFYIFSEIYHIFLLYLHEDLRSIFDALLSIEKEKTHKNWILPI